MPRLSLEEAKAALPNVTLGDAALLALIEDIEDEIVDRFGPYAPTSVAETLRPIAETDRLVLSRKAASITSVVEWISPTETRTLDPSDYLLEGPYTLVRLRSGTTPSWKWSTGYGGHRVDVVFVPLDDTKRRKGATIDVLKLEAGFEGGKTQERIGDYSYSSGPASGRTSQTVTEDRAKILSRLRPKRFVVR